MIFNGTEYLCKQQLVLFLISKIGYHHWKVDCHISLVMSKSIKKAGVIFRNCVKY